jgi:ribosome-associated protein
MSLDSVFHWRDHLLSVLDDKQARNPQWFPVTSPFAEYFIVVSATSSRHLWALCQAIELACKTHRVRVKSQGRHDDTQWIVLNANGVFVHLFLDESRAYYDLEGLWKEEQSHEFLEPLDPLTPQRAIDE